jgi:branched-chain amino acid transport system permease protein
MMSRLATATRGMNRREVAWELWATIGLLVLLPLLVATDYGMHIWTRMAIYLILLTGLNFIQGVAGMISLAQAGFFGLGAYAAGIAAVRYDVPPVLALALAPLVVTAVALLLGVISMRLKEIYFKMATLGAGFVLFLLFGRMVEVTGGPNGLVGIPPFSVFGFEFSEPIVRYALVAAFAIVGAVVAHNLLVSRTGRALRAYGASEPAALAAGASPFRLRLLAFGLSGFYAGVAGALEAFDSRFISPSTFDFMMAVLLVVALVVSGAGRMIGPVLGALLLTGIEVFAADYADFEPLIMGVIFLIAVQLFPRGLAGELAARRGDRREQKKRQAVPADEAQTTVQAVQR